MSITTRSAPSAGRPDLAAVRIGHLVGAAGGAPDLGTHLESYGPTPRMADGQLTDLAGQAGLTGRGGAAFPTARKLAAVRAANRRRGPVVVANAAEGEPASHKDRWLLAVRPNLVLDGLQLAAAEVRAARVVLYLHRDAELVAALDRLIARRAASGLDERHVEVVAAPHRFLAGEESSLASRVGGGLALPRFKGPRVYEAGVGGAPTLVQNAETLAQLALLARFGPEWFRAAGLPDEPGTTLATAHAPGGSRVLEVELGAPLSAVLGDALHPGGPVGAVLVGGFHGAWLSLADAHRMRLANADLRSAGAAVGAAVVAALPVDRCGLVETARVVGYLAGESAGQCGPCLNGLPAIAGGVAELAGPRPRPQVLDDVRRWSGLVVGRGACHHPDGTVRLVRSALTVFADELTQHRAGRCSAVSREPFLALPWGIPTHDGEWS